MAKFIDIDGQRFMAPTGRSTVAIGADGRRGYTANEDGEIVVHHDLASALEMAGWVFVGKPTRQ